MTETRPLRKAVTRDFDAAILREDWQICWGGDAIVQERIVDTRRWSVIHEVVFRAPDDGLLYRARYSVGATEYQNEKPWEYEQNVTAVQVEEYQQTVTAYRDVTELDS